MIQRRDLRHRIVGGRVVDGDHLDLHRRDRHRNDCRTRPIVAPALRIGITTESSAGRDMPFAAPCLAVRRMSAGPDADAGRPRSRARPIG